MKLIIKFMIFITTLIFNFRVFPFNIAIKLPVLISYRVKVKNLHKNCIEINSDISKFMIRINVDDGSEGVNIYHSKKGYFSIKKEGKIIFNGKANFLEGISIRVDRGILEFGDNFGCNKDCFISCSENIKFGRNVVIGWGTNIRDSDGHDIYDLEKNIIINENKSVLIGNNVWIGSNVDILKNTEIPDNCVVGMRSCVTRKFMDTNCIIGGYPAKVIKTNIEWKV